MKSIRFTNAGNFHFRRDLMNSSDFVLRDLFMIKKTNLKLQSICYECLHQIEFAFWTVDVMNLLIRKLDENHHIYS